MSKDIETEIKQHLEETKAVILQGPPGTGKTYTARKVVEQYVNTEETEDSQTEGNTENSDDIFNRLHEWTWTSISRGKDFDAHEIGDKRDYNFPNVNGDDNGEQSLSELDVIWELIQLHPSYSYENFVRGVEIKTGNENDGINFKESDRLVVQLAKVAEVANSSDESTPVILVLDEINRCNLSDVLGELILTLEEDKRGDWPVRLQYPPPENGEDDTGGFVLPENLYVIGTMNTADQSIAKIDYAIRRRFRFIEVPPDEEAITNFYEERKSEISDCETRSEIATSIMKGINDSNIEETRLEIGHSYFLIKGEREIKDWKHALANRLAYDVFPLLREYKQNNEGGLSDEVEVDVENENEVSRFTLDFESNQSDIRDEVKEAIEDVLNSKTNGADESNNQSGGEESEEGGGE